MTSRGRLVLAFGVLTYVAAWGFGSRPLYPVAVGLVVAPLVAWAWVHASNRPGRVVRVPPRRDFLEGDDVAVELQLDLPGRVPPPAATLVERVAKVGLRTEPVSRERGRVWVRYVLERLPRGRYVFEDTRLVIHDPFGLQRTEVELPEPPAVLVYPRLVRLATLFSESGAYAHDGRRLLLRRPTGFDLHSVREYERGESLRKVHWPSTARRGQLMVKDLEDAPREEVAVLLDASVPAVGESFDVQVRAAGSILETHVRRGRRAALVVNAREPAIQLVHSDAGDWRRALELLAAAEPDGRSAPAALLNGDATPAARALELTVVTARLDAQLVQRLVERTLARRGAALVFVDAASFNGGAAKREPALLRLQAAGVPLTVVRGGDDLAERLSGLVLEEAADA